MIYLDKELIPPNIYISRTQERKETKNAIKVWEEELKRQLPREDTQMA